jgi:phosphoribosylformimino-5-aminoimidazole carboxamide ribotide isomerase
VIAAPAVDLKGGRCVQLVGGRAEDERVSLPDPVAVARHWWSLGFGTLHVVDLDAALGNGENDALIARVVTTTPATAQVGGGIRDDARAHAVLAGGAHRIVVGTRAVEDPAWLEALATRHPHRVVVAADVRDGRVLSRGWTETSQRHATDYVAKLGGLPLAGVLCTDVSREGRLEGIDVPSMASVIEAAAHPVWIAGGITTISDLEALEAAGAAGVVLGMAIYTSTLDARAVAERWGGAPGDSTEPPEPSESPDPPRIPPNR